MISRKCCVCGKCFEVKYPSNKTRTCGKQCKNRLASDITQKQFSTKDSRLKHAEITKRAMKKVDMKSVVSRRRSYKGENHPLYGKPCSESRKQKIGEANRGRFKGKTWEEIYDHETVCRMKKHNAICMAKTNAKLLNGRTSELEKKIAREMYQFGFRPNKRIGKYTVDLLNKKTKEIIEIYGDYWHANPQMFNPKDEIRCIGMIAEDKWEYDAKRIKYLEGKGYTVKVYWESELKGE